MAHVVNDLHIENCNEWEIKRFTIDSLSSHNINLFSQDSEAENLQSFH